MCFFFFLAQIALKTLFFSLVQLMDKKKKIIKRAVGSYNSKAGLGAAELSIIVNFSHSFFKKLYITSTLYGLLCKKNTGTLQF